jgi:hypothetical protein
MSNHFEDDTDTADGQQQGADFAAEHGDAATDPPILNDEVIEQDLAEVPPKKKGLNPRVAVLGLGAVVLVVVGVMGVKAAGVLGAPKAAAVDYEAEMAMIHASQQKAGTAPAAAPATGLLPSAQASAPDAGTGMLSAPLEAASAPAVDPTTGTAPTASPAADPSAVAAATPAAPAVAPATAPAVTVAVAAPQAAVADPKAMEGVTTRMQALEQRMDALENARQTQLAAAAAQPAVEQAPRKPRKVAVAKPVKKAEPKEDVLEPGSLPGLQLRAVHPSFGPDMQAWVLEGDQVRVVNRGSMVAGARVLEVRSNSVVTDRGVIR